MENGPVRRTEFLVTARAEQRQRHRQQVTAGGFLASDYSMIEARFRYSQADPKGLEGEEDV